MSPYSLGVAQLLRPPTPLLSTHTHTSRFQTGVLTDKWYTYRVAETDETKIKSCIELNLDPVLISALCPSAWHQICSPLPNFVKCLLCTARLNWRYLLIVWFIFELEALEHFCSCSHFPYASLFFSYTEVMRVYWHLSNYLADFIACFQSHALLKTRTRVPHWSSINDQLSKPFVQLEQRLRPDHSLFSCLIGGKWREWMCLHNWSVPGL